MPHDHHCGCGCSHDHIDTQHANPSTTAEVTENQKNFLHQLSHTHYLPVARFVVEDSRETDFASIALSPVFIRSTADDMATVKEAGAFLQQLEDMGLITLDYDMPLNAYNYEEYKESALYEYFCATVAECATKPGFLGNTPVLELGSMALTEAGAALAATHCGSTHHHDCH
ncbi:MAG: hypothetical protein RR528_03715 [Angelakisella sp.]